MFHSPIWNVGAANVEFRRNFQLNVEMEVFNAEQQTRGSHQRDEDVDFILHVSNASMNADEVRNYLDLFRNIRDTLHGSGLFDGYKFVVVGSIGACTALQNSDLDILLISPTGSDDARKTQMEHSVIQVFNSGGTNNGCNCQHISATLSKNTRGIVQTTWPGDYSADIAIDLPYSFLFTNLLKSYCALEPKLIYSFIAIKQLCNEEQNIVHKPAAHMLQILILHHLHENNGVPNLVKNYPMHFSDPNSIITPTVLANFVKQNEKFENYAGGVKELYVNILDGIVGYLSSRSGVYSLRYTMTVPEARNIRAARNVESDWDIELRVQDPFTYRNVGKTVANLDELVQTLEGEANRWRNA